MTDGELVRRSVAGETAAYGELARRWYRRLFAFCEARVRMGDAEDLVQDVLLRAYHGLGTLGNPDHFGPWLRGIAQHACLDWCRQQYRQRRHRTNPDVELVPDRTPQSGLCPDERAVLRTQLALIPEELREVILLHYYENQTYDAMAQWLGVARATVSERLAKARALLRIRLASLRSDV